METVKGRLETVMAFGDTITFLPDRLVNEREFTGESYRLTLLHGSSTGKKRMLIEEGSMRGGGIFEIERMSSSKMRVGFPGIGGYSNVYERKG